MKKSKTAAVNQAHAKNVSTGPIEIADSEARTALVDGDPEVIADYLRYETPKEAFLLKLADAIDPRTQNISKCRFRLIRPRGKPRSNRTTRMIEDDQIEMMMAFAKTRKIESAVQAVTDKTGISRARIFRAKKRSLDRKSK